MSESSELLYRRDLRKIRTLAHEVLRQCDFYERNGHGDAVRFWTIDGAALKLFAATGVPARRVSREHGYEPRPMYRPDRKKR